MTRALLSPGDAALFDLALDVTILAAAFLLGPPWTLRRRWREATRRPAVAPRHVARYRP